jgi:ubiquinol-cytochrome c reductase cytochrome b subunit
MSLGNWLDERTGWRAVVHHALDEPMKDGASFAYVMGSVLLFLILLQATTGALLAFYYSPSSTDAWASVAYIEDQVQLGWLIRGLHHHGASAIVIAAGLHLAQVALWGAYRRPREMNWWTGVLLLGLLLAFALTGYLLPWDQTGYWATKVATGIAGETPVFGTEVREAVQAGNEYGNLTLTRFFALHVLVLPALTAGLVVVHLALFRRHGVTPHWWRSSADLERRAQPFWPDQLFRDLVGMAVAFAGLLGFVAWSGGAGLDSPADPSSAFDARPEWYFRPLFQALKYFSGPMETIAALGAPVVVGGFLIALPFLDRGPDRRPRARLLPLGLLALGGLAAVALTWISFAADAADPALAEREEASEARAQQARRLARQNGVPAAGGTAVFQTAPHWKARTVWAERCVHCHDGDERKGPVIGAGYGSRAWIRGFLVDPSGDAYYGRTKLGTSERAMPPVDQTGRDLDALVELVYAESGDPAIDAALVTRGRELYEEVCSDCHEIEAGKDSDPGPNLAGRGTAAWLASFIADPGTAVHFGERNEMPAFDDELAAADREELAAYLVWLRSASDADIVALGTP